MRVLTLASLATAALAAEVTIDVTRAVECDRKTKVGDKISVHYRGTLQSDGSEFDASYNRGTPLDFTVGRGQVIKGWDDNLLDMCIGEKRTLTIPPEFGYGNSAQGPIPAGSTLIFETELMAIAGVKAPEKIVEKPVASKATEGIKAAVESKIAEAAEAVKVVISDTDQDGQEHNEL
ncbi:peptidylprolyl isomerase [Drepanopeziza brunnea f. sp. 'multigermtubi' MB_m1]|uniref:peptidylprolyl isomerase n=1 Tax=Marssonina brunnea f. sp. multigermtubi (strain MB_m1) TaxID=1072389 RepID=K1X9V5_MARBU|nr:peptidylprolyl isomerase [Drepanopeziza brunnea f. sp. 'multigermtubi' MB_m1]EKD21802.1 peptidylprolyl isomerase [Drepanopeziza brunnea f. sp. 'multigermtubi' MB_m1]